MMSQPIIGQSRIGIKMKKVLLIHPWIEDFSAYDFWVKPLGLLAVGTVLKEAGCEVELIDCVDRVALGAPDKPFGTGKIPGIFIAKPPPLAQIPRRFKRFGMDDASFDAKLRTFGRPDLVLITCMMTYWYRGAFRAIRKVREAYPGVPVGLGGNYVSLCLQHARERSGADLLFPEKNWPALMRKIGRMLGTDDLSARPTPPPRIDFTFYPKLRSAALITSRGCPYRCTYCAASRLYPEFTQDDPARVAAAIAAYAERYAVQDIAFFDDAFLVGATGHAHRIFEGLIQLRNGGLQLRFHLPNAVHAAAITQKTAALMFEARFKTIRLGLESTAPGFHAERSSRKLTNGTFEQAVHHLRVAGFTAGEMGAYVLYGLPGVTPASVLATLETVQAAGLRACLATYSPVPGTPDFEQAARKNPRLRQEPLLHNQHLCCHEDPPAYQRVRDRANAVNHRLMAGIRPT